MTELLEVNNNFLKNVLDENESDLDGEENFLEDQVCEFTLKNDQDNDTKKRYSIFDIKLKQIKWINLIFLTWLHIFAVYGYIHGLFNPVRFFTVIWVSVISFSSGLGMSVGKHKIT